MQLDFNGIHVLVIGDIMLDRYLTGSISRISPEAPVPILEDIRYEDRLGGAANVALNLKHLGAEPHLIGVIGVDQNSKSLLQALTTEGISHKFIERDPERKTTIKTRVLADNHHILRVDNEDVHNISPQVMQSLTTSVQHLIYNQKIDIVVFQDYNKGVLTSEFIKTTTTFLREQGVPFSVDPKVKNFWKYKGAAIFKPNLKEILEATHSRIRNYEEDLSALTAKLRSTLQIEQVYVTLGEDGLFYQSATSVGLYPTVLRNVADVCGAGDAVLSIMSLAFVRGFSCDEICRLSNVVGGQVCEKPGVVPINLTELRKELTSLAHDI